MHEGSIGIEDFSQITPIHYSLKSGTASTTWSADLASIPQNRPPTISGFCYELINHYRVCQSHGASCPHKASNGTRPLLQAGTTCLNLKV